MYVDAIGRVSTGRKRWTSITHQRKHIRVKGDKWMIHEHLSQCVNSYLAGILP
ncbi:hypothetical protein JCM19039_4635 [Geomicrobium sp. JCM 19039]|nr:hypothetical protein JCM19039_4635 [Geomicrobium sp. JCM 19039]